MTAFPVFQIHGTLQRAMTNIYVKLDDIRNGLKM